MSSSKSTKTHHFIRISPQVLPEPQQRTEQAAQKARLPAHSAVVEGRPVDDILTITAPSAPSGGGPAGGTNRRRAQRGSGENGAANTETETAATTDDDPVHPTAIVEFPGGETLDPRRSNVIFRL